MSEANLWPRRPGVPTNLPGRAAKSDVKKFARFHRHMRERGIALPPSQFEAWFVSDAHTKADLDRTAEAIRAFKA